VTLLTRRQALGSLGAAVSVSCARRPRPGAEPRVSILKASGYTQGLFDQVRRLLAEHQVQVRGQRVLLKPNLVEFDPATTINTHPLLVHAALEAFRALGAAEVRIAEGPGHRRLTLDLAEDAGYFDALPDFERHFTDLNLDEVSEVRIRRPFSELKSLYLPRTALACDLLVSLPKMKTHHWAGATLAMKNLFGVVPGAVYGWPKNLLHWAGIHECIADLYGLFPRQFCLVDGIVAMEGNGPIQGSPRTAGVLVAGADPVAVDATCCRIMGINPAKVRYLSLAGGRGQTESQYVRQIGEPLPGVQGSFALIPEIAWMRLPAA